RSAIRRTGVARPLDASTSPMNTAQSFMLRRILLCTTGIAAALSASIILMDPEGLFGLLTGGSVSLGQFLLISVLFVPTVFCHAGPFSVAMATSFLYHGWLKDREVVSLRAVGLSEWSIAWPGIAAALIATVLTACVTIFILPLSAGKLFDIVFTASQSKPYRMLREGSFNQAAPGISLSFRSWNGDRAIDDVTIYDDRVRDTLRLIRADAGNFFPSDRGDVLELENGTFTQLSDHDGVTGPIAFKQMEVLLDHSRVNAGSRPTTWFEQPIWRLLEPPPDIEPGSQTWSGWASEGHQRIITPLLCLNYALLALGIILRCPPSVRSASYHLAGASAILALLHICMVTTHSMVVRNYHLLFVLYSFAVVPGAVGVALLWLGNRKLRLTEHRMSMMGRQAEVARRPRAVAAG
ncbi:MAG TPA: LptF/LptG family permease, partial [Stellaceae bacterium]|nr:LptF/LptG family permease [Stellaceae bacterium]